jgi:CTP:molybdopterin cytidylyltransferase MocA
MSSSVRRGLRQARYSAAVLLLPVDLVELRTRDVARLISRWRGSRRTVVARRLHSAAATPLILPRHLYARALGVTGDQGLRQFVRGLPGSVSLVDMPSAAADVDTAQDLARARRRRGRWP